MSIDPVVTEVHSLLGESAGDSIDQITRDYLVGSTTTVQYEILSTNLSNRMSVGSGQNLSVTALQKAVRTMRAANVKPLTFGGKSRYVLIDHPNAVYDLMHDSNLQTAMLYGFGQTTTKDSVPSWEEGQVVPTLDVVGVRIYDSTNAKVYPTAGMSQADVYIGLLLGEGAYGVIGHDAGSVKTYFVGLEASKSDPLGQRWYAGWKALHGQVILNQSAIVRIEHAYSGQSGYIT
jgi:N4-gp56 family major capsid protein